MLDGERSLFLSIGAVLDVALCVEFEAFLSERESHLFCELGGTLSEVIVVKLDHFAAIHTDEVIVVRVLAVDRIVAFAAITEVFFHGEALLHEEFQGAVHGGVADASLCGLDLGVEFIGGDVFIELEEALCDGIALFCGFEGLVFESGVERLHGGLDLFIRGEFILLFWVLWEIAHEKLFKED